MKIAIAGYGAEGESNYRYYHTPDNQVVIVDEHEPTREVPTDASCIIGQGAFSKLDGYDLVIRTAGLSPRKIKTDGKVWSATNEFFAACPAPIIGVTGSKGKGTTCSLIASVLRAAGYTVHLVGNIGVPALDVLPTIQAGDLVVYELSSFQLWDLAKSPQTAVVLMIEPDHLDVHADMDEYVTAKSQIARHQTATDRVIFNQENQYARTIADTSPAVQVGFPTTEYAHVQNGAFWYGEQYICSTDKMMIAGVHNLDNACAAICAVWPWVQDGEVIAQGLSAFTGLPHRLKFVRELHGVTYYDDSIATTPGSAIAALRAFDKPKVILLGGSDKGADYTQLINEIAASDSVRRILTIGQTGETLTSLLKSRGLEQIVDRLPATDMNDIVEVASACAQPGDVVILSPACASFDMFKSYSDRGDKFIDAVNALQ